MEVVGDNRWRDMIKFNIVSCPLKLFCHWKWAILHGDSEDDCDVIPQIKKKSAYDWLSRESMKTYYLMLESH